MNIQQIAKEAGVSTATVSRVINGKKDVNEDTRARIIKIINNNGFKPKVAVTQIIDNIGVFISDEKTSLSNPYSSLILSGLADVLFKQHLNITLIPSEKISRDGIEFSNFCRQRRISGGIFLSSTLDDTYIVELGKHVPVVTIGNDLKSQYVGSVRSDNFKGAYSAVEYLVKTGHKRIMFIMADMHFLDHKERYEGGKKAIEDAGLEHYPFNVLNSYLLNNFDLSYTLEYQIKTDKPDAIFVGGDQEAIRVIRVLQDKGIKIPEDISIIGYDNLPISSSTYPPLTTVNQPIYEIGQESAKLLLQMIKDKKHMPKSTLIQSNHLMIRESICERKA